MEELRLSSQWMALKTWIPCCSYEDSNSRARFATELVQGRLGWGPEQPDLMNGIPTHGREVGTRGSLRSFQPNFF